MSTSDWYPEEKYCETCKHAVSGAAPAPDMYICALYSAKKGPKPTNDLAYINIAHGFHAELVVSAKFSCVNHKAKD